MLNGKGFKSRALVGGWAAWLKAGGETEPADAPAASAQSNDAEVKQEKHVVASPNPRAEGKGVEKIGGEAKELQPVEAVKASPMKSKKKGKAQATKPRP